MTLQLKNKIIIAIILLTTLTGCNVNKINKGIDIPEETITIEQPKIEDYKVSLFAIGDTLIHDAVYYDAQTNQIGDDGYPIYDFKPMFTEIAPLAQQHDLAFYNQERYRRSCRGACGAQHLPHTRLRSRRRLFHGRGIPRP